MGEYPNGSEQIGAGFEELIMKVLKENMGIEIWDDRHTITVDVYFDGEVICSDKHTK